MLVLLCSLLVYEPSLSSINCGSRRVVSFACAYSRPIPTWTSYAHPLWTPYGPPGPYGPPIDPLPLDPLFNVDTPALPHPSRYAIAARSNEFFSRQEYVDKQHQLQELLRTRSLLNSMLPDVVCLTVPLNRPTRPSHSTVPLDSPTLVLL